VPKQKILELIEAYTKTDIGGQELSELLHNITQTQTDPSKVTESLILLFSIVDTNHKKNKDLIVSLLTIQLKLSNEIEECCENKTQKPKTSNTKKSSKTGIGAIAEGIGEAIKKSPFLFFGGTFIIAIIIIFFVLYNIDSKKTDKVVDTVTKVTKIITPKESKK